VEAPCDTKEKVEAPGSDQGFLPLQKNCGSKIVAQKRKRGSERERRESESTSETALSFFSLHCPVFKETQLKKKEESLGREKKRARARARPLSLSFSNGPSSPLSFLSVFP
jgi:hypothetical protein